MHFGYLRARPFLLGAWLVVLFAAMGVMQISANPARKPRTGVDPKTGMAFPLRAGAFEREGSIRYDDGGYPVATYYAGALAMATVFYYKNAPFGVEYANARKAVKDASPSARVVSDGQCQLLPSGRRTVFTLNGEAIRRPNEKFMSELLMFPHRDMYLTFRITYPLGHKDRAHQEIDRFVRAFKFP